MKSKREMRLTFLHTFLKGINKSELSLAESETVLPFEIISVA
jgi:hypothetical protein